MAAGFQRDVDGGATYVVSARSRVGHGWISAWLPPGGWVKPAPMMRRSLTMTQPTRGLGVVSSMPKPACSKASAAGLLVILDIELVERICGGSHGVQRR
jgi:hypothetical protein